MARCSDSELAPGFSAKAAGAILLFLLMFSAVSCEASVRVDGLNDWLSLGAERSLNAVYEHIPPGGANETKERLLTVVADRLLSGYMVESVAFTDEGDVSLKLAVRSKPPEWDVVLVPPNLSAPANEWFASDVSDISSRLEPMMEGVPIEALSWGDVDLKKTVEAICGEKLPGWRTSLMVRAAVEGGSILEISFVPEQPLILAVTFSINSTSIPVMLHSSLREDLTAGFAPVIGVPVPWLERHMEDFKQFGNMILLEESLVDRAKAEPELDVKFGPVSEVDIDLESRRYAAWIWAAVYAGTENKYPEIGMHFGRRAQIFPHWDIELYMEFIVALNDWALETRLGMRWSPWRNVWLGGEWSDFEDRWWVRASLDSKPRNPYAWIRYSESGDTNGSIGYRINDFISVEVHYDSRSDDAWNVRALVNM